MIYTRRPQGVCGLAFVNALLNHPQVDGIDYDSRSPMIGVRFRVATTSGLGGVIADWVEFVRTVYDQFTGET